MRLRITKTHTKDETQIRVDGELVEEGVTELEAMMSRLEGRTILDLAGLTRLELVGTALVRRLARDGVVLKGVAPYFSILLGGGSGEGSAEMAFPSTDSISSLARKERAG
jgi:hypothetical protein